MDSTVLLATQAPVSVHHRLVTVEPVQFLFSLYYAGSIPLIAQFVQSQLQKQSNSTTSDLPCGVSSNDSNVDHIKSEASTWLICMNVAAMVHIFVPFDVFIHCFVIVTEKHLPLTAL